MTTTQEQLAYTSLVPWFGAKRALAPRIAEIAGPHRAWFSLFCGSCAVELVKEPCSHTTVNDLHGDLINLARVVQDEEMSSRLYWKLRRLIPSEAMFRESHSIISQPPTFLAIPDVTRAYHYFVTCWLGLNGLAGCQTINQGFGKRFTSGGGSSSVRIVNAVESLPWWHELMRYWMIVQGDGITLAERIEDKDGTIIYADPPYIEEGDLYLHSFTQEASIRETLSSPGEEDGKRNDHVRLAVRLRRFQHTRVMVSYYDHPDLAVLYPGWTVIRMATTKVLRQRDVSNSAPQAPEVLLTNLPVKETDRGLFA